MALRRFTQAEIEKLRFMASFGHDGKSIARALDRTPQAVRVKAVEIGVRLRRPSAESRRFKISVEAWRKYQVKGEQLGASPSRLVRLVAEKAADIIDAVIDEPVPRRRKLPAPLPLPAPPPPAPSFLDVLRPRLVGTLSRETV
jgi:hypothetical protein